jgi:Copper chaperone
MCKFCGCFRFGKPDKEVISVEGMMCVNCKNAVEEVLRGLPGVLSAEVDLEAKNVTVEYDHHKNKKEDFVAAIEEIGYDVIA